MQAGQVTISSALLSPQSIHSTQIFFEQSGFNITIYGHSLQHFQYSKHVWIGGELEVVMRRCRHSAASLNDAMHACQCE